MIVSISALIALFRCNTIRDVTPGRDRVCVVHGRVVRLVKVDNKDTV